MVTDIQLVLYKKKSYATLEGSLEKLESMVDTNALNCSLYPLIINSAGIKLVISTRITERLLGNAIQESLQHILPCEGG